MALKPLDLDITDLKKWTTIINHHNEMVFDENRDFGSETYQRTTLMMINAFSAMFKLFIKAGRYRDEWDDAHYHTDIYGCRLIIKSQKTGSQYYFGIDEKGIFIESSLKHFEHLKNMKDDFWQALLSLTDYAHFEFTEYEGYRQADTQSYPHLFRSSKSTVYQLFRRFFFTEFNGGEFERTSPGALKVTWTNDSNLDEILQAAHKVFKTLYQLNHVLWQVEDRQQKRQNKV